VNDYALTYYFFLKIKFKMGFITKNTNGKAIIKSIQKFFAIFKATSLQNQLNL